MRKKQNDKYLRKIVRESVRRFHHLGNRTISRYILAEYGELFENDLEKIRSRVRRVVGANGKTKRGNAVDKSLWRDASNIELPPTWGKTRTDYNLPEGLWLVISDLHIPFHEPQAIQAAVQAGHVEKVDGVFINGDAFDCAAVSFWPQQKREWNQEVESFIDFLDWLRIQFPFPKKIVYKPGNHEYRLPSYFVRNAPELVGSPLTAMETIMDFEGRQIEFLDYFQKVMAGKLPVIHGHEIHHISRAVNPARGLFLKAKTFAACSHCHSTSEHTPKDIHGQILTTWSFGCLCNLSPDWNSLGNDWNHGFGLINVEKNGHFEVINRRILPSGKVV